ncbi:uncharacterized protein BDR25DRAFT_361115 [Lindgomyces ingoldianus]|uniref:Uncharacterized protein n=1 Tax=Lindgomyces ingoldianus TaxID=673940 RepID=A0ACB6QE49_9PLEO|nr:uncharacterized protein BDR25DRAFT_361115 [Lindgomyces ingoldianus]KAF2464888.1 hypothetical protein BDR25DRAFT_361115 [Lindgomyces ingoldianus]
MFYEFRPVSRINFNARIHHATKSASATRTIQIQQSDFLKRHVVRKKSKVSTSYRISTLFEIDEERERMVLHATSSENFVPFMGGQKINRLLQERGTSDCWLHIEVICRLLRKGSVTVMLVITLVLNLPIPPGNQPDALTHRPANLEDNKICLSRASFNAAHLWSQYLDIYETQG